MPYSPTLAVATAGFELAAAAWVLTGPGRKELLRTSAAILVFLAGYQVVEAVLCTMAPRSEFLPRLAFLVVTWLPPLGLLLASFLLSQGDRPARSFAHGMFVLAAGFCIWILLDPGFATLSACAAVYARYDHARTAFLAYSAYYWAGLLGLAGFSAYGAARPHDPHDGRLAKLMFLGSLALIVPAVVTSRLLPTPDGALPSVMCHFAVLLAIGLVRLVQLERAWAGAPSRERGAVEAAGGRG